MGSGYIAVELAGILNALGSEVSLVVRYHKCLRTFDDLLSDALMEEMANAGINVIKFSTVIPEHTSPVQYQTPSV